MRFIVSFILGLFVLPTALAGQDCPLGTLGSAVTALEQEVRQCGELRRQTTDLASRLERIEWRMDQFVIDHNAFDTLLAQFRAEVAQQALQTQPEVQEQSDWPIILGVAALILGASALYVALNHHHEVEHTGDDVTGRTTVIVIPRPTGVCWPPGHCKRNK